MFSSKLKFLCGMIAACLLAFAPAVGEAQKDLQKEIQKLKKEVNALEKRVTDLEQAHEPMYLTVDCAAGETVADALAQAEAQTGRVEITVAGTCVEEVTIHRSNTWLIGASPGDGLQAPSPTSLVLLIIGAYNVRLNNLTVSGGLNGILADLASFTAGDLHVEGASWSGITIMGADADIRDSVIQNNGDGIKLTRGSLSLRATKVISNWAGVNCGGGELEVGGGSTVSDNTSYGIVGNNGTSVMVSDSIIDNNGGTGISLQIGSTGHIFEGSRISNNNWGIYVDNGSAATITHSGDPTLASPIIEVNSLGVYISGASSVWMGEGIIRANTGDGIFIEDTSVLAGNGQGQIINNTGIGILCSSEPNVPGIHGQRIDAFTVNGNGGGQINCPGLVR